MKKHLSLSAVLIVAVLLSGCESAGPNTQEKATMGALGGAILGGIIGHQSGRGLEGAAIGAAAGGVAGGVYGNSQDKAAAQKMAYERQLAAERAENARMAAQAEQARLMNYGYAVDAPEVMAARQRAEALEAEVSRLRQEQEAALQRAREIEAYQAREAAAQQELMRLKGQQPQYSY